jgi:DNA-binding NarL/FixJ family response regulator
MFLCPPSQAAAEMKKGADEPRIFYRMRIITIVKAPTTGSLEEEIILDLTKAGWDQLQQETEMEEHRFLSHVKQVVALICHGYRIIRSLVAIAPETMKTHLQNIFDKFNLRSSKELRLVLKDWNLAEWWDQNWQA